jgi:hypothetical protein
MLLYELAESGDVFARATVKSGATFGETFSLEQWGTARRPLAQRDLLEVALRWRTLAKPRYDYQIFVTALDSRGNVLGGTVRGDWTSRWRPGSELVHYYRLWLPSGSSQSVRFLKVAIFGSTPRWGNLPARLARAAEFNAAISSWW